MIRIHTNRYFSLLLVFILIMIQAVAQKTGYVQVSGKIKKDSRPLSACEINVMQNGSVLQTVQTKENGSFVFNLDLQKDYRISFGKTGLVTKSIIFDTRVPQDQSDIIYQNEFNIDLFDDVAGVSQNNAMSKPVAKIAFNPTYEDFVHDDKYTKIIQAEQDKVRKDAEALAKQKDKARLDSLNKTWSDSLIKTQDREAALLAQNADQERLRKEQEKNRLDSIARAQSNAKLQAELEQKEKARLDSMTRANAELARKDSLAGVKARSEAETLTRIRDRTLKDSLAKADVTMKSRQKFLADSIAKAQSDKARFDAAENAKAMAEAKAKEQERKDSLAKADAAFKARQKFVSDSTAQALAGKAKQDALAKAQADAEAKSIDLERKDSITKAVAAFNVRQKFVADSTLLARTEKKKQDALSKTQADAAKARQQLASDSLAKVQAEKTRQENLAKAKAETERQKQVAEEKAKTDSIAWAAQRQKEKEDSEKKAKIQADIQAKKDLQAKLYDKKEAKPPLNTRPSTAIPKILDSDYKEGITEETLSEPNRKIYRTVVKVAGATNNYQKIIYDWGGVFCFKNQLNMTESSFDQEIKNAKASIKN